MKPSHALFVLFATAACGGPEANADSDVRGEANEALIRRMKPKFVTAERDQKKCLHGACGGWLLTDANDPAAPPVYVQALTLQSKDLDANADQLEGAGAGDLVLYGRATGTLVPGFEVTAAWRALPGGTPGKGERLFQLQDTNGCTGLWCRPRSVVELNTTTVASVEDFGLALEPGVHRAWVDARVAQGRALALGTFAKGTSFDAFAASRVFLQLPERRDCPQVKPPPCSSGVTKLPPIATFRLDADRCLGFDQCTVEGPCPEFFVQPACTAGYIGREFRTAPNACSALTCDPAWAE